MSLSPPLRQSPARARRHVLLAVERPPASSVLTRREADVLRLIAVGLTDRQVAATLGVSRKTASNHVANILRKLEVPTRAAAVARAISERLILTTPTTDAFPVG